MAFGVQRKDDKYEQCEACIKGKQHRLPFPKSAERATEILQIVHSDLCGPMHVTSFGGARYVVTFTDDFTRYTVVYFLKMKNEVFAKFLEYKALMEKQTSKQIKTLRSDNGGEYISNAFNDFLRANGIRHETTVPYTPEHNAVSERLNRTLVEKARTMLADSSLPLEYWAEAVCTATYLKNRSPTKAVENMTPYEALTGKKPSLRHLRIFGCKAMVYIPNEK